MAALVPSVPVPAMENHCRRMTYESRPKPTMVVYLDCKLQGLLYSIGRCCINPGYPEYSSRVITDCRHLIISSVAYMRRNQVLLGQDVPVLLLLQSGSLEGKRTSPENAALTFPLITDTNGSSAIRMSHKRAFSHFHNY